MKSSARLRQVFGEYTPFTMKRIRRKQKEVPDWALSRAGVQKVLLTAFPKLHTSPRQRARAGRWALVIYLYFQSCYSYSEVAEEMREKPRTVECLIRSIKRVAGGRRADGRGPLVRAHAVIDANMGRVIPPIMAAIGKDIDHQTDDQQERESTHVLFNRDE